MSDFIEKSVYYKTILIIINQIDWGKIMKYTSKLIFSGLLSSILVVSATAGTLTPSSESSKVSLNSNAVTATSSIKSGDTVAVYEGSAVLSYKGCEQTVPANYFVKVDENGSCSAVQALDAPKVKRIDPTTANRDCLQCKAKLASKGGLFSAGASGVSAATVVAVVAGVAVVAAIASDNKSASN